MQKKLFLFILLISFLSCSRNEIELLEELNEDNIISENITVEVTEEDDYLIIIAAGDNLYHNVMVRSGEEGDYEAAYSEILSLVQSADIAFINQETVLGGRDFGFTGFPLFNSPQALGRAISNVGFNVVSHANNHAMDRGERALIATMDFWDTIPEVRVLGIHRSEEARNNPIIMEINNISVGFLAYSFGTNGIPLPTARPYMVSLINMEIMESEISALRPLCDFLIVSMHWGNEYQHHYSSRQRELAAFLAEQEVDLVLGHHPHVLQPVEYIQRPDGRFMLCFYSLGNFISAQATPPTMLGAMAYIRIKRLPSPNEGERNTFIFVDEGAIPVVTHFEDNWINFKIYPLYAYSDEIAQRHRKNREEMVLSMDYLTDLSTRVLGVRAIMRNPFD